MTRQSNPSLNQHKEIMIAYQEVGSHWDEIHNAAVHVTELLRNTRDFVRGAPDLRNLHGTLGELELLSRMMGNFTASSNKMRMHFYNAIYNGEQAFRETLRTRIRQMYRADAEQVLSDKKRA